MTESPKPKHRSPWSRVLQKAQAVSGAAIGVFLVGHLGNTAAAALPPPAYDAYQVAFRKFYQHPVVEAALFVGIGVHVAAALAVAMGVGSAPSVTPPVSKPLRDRLFSWSGWIMMTFIGGHVYFTRMQPATVEFAGLSFTMQHSILRFFFIPYYTLFALAGVLHTMVGLQKAAHILAIAPPRSAKTLRRAAQIGAIVLGTAVVLGLSGLAGVFYSAPLQYDHPYVVDLRAKSSIQL